MQTSPGLSDDEAMAAALIHASRAARTMDAYRSDWASFCRWAHERAVDSDGATAAHVAAYVGYLVTNGHQPSTIERAISGLSAAYRAAGRPDNPCRSEIVRVALAGMRRRLGTSQRQARPLSTAELARLVAATPRTLIGARDRALLLIGFAGALRRSELVALDLADVREVPRGLELTIRRSKTDQEGQGTVVPVARAKDCALCPTLAWAAWCSAADLEQGAAWRAMDRHGNLRGRLSDRAVSLIIARAAAAAGVSTDQLSAHSLRAGYVTTAAQRGASERAISRVSRHRSIPVLRSYIRRATPWDDAATDLGI